MIFLKMDKKKLNNEIILCRPAVRKARVVIIRKLLKKMKILKSCKKEGVKDKKLKKCERIFKKVQIMKKLKDDDVTKFALKNKDLEVFIKEPKSNLRENALACLAKHESVMKRVNGIREQIPNWEEEVPLLLDSLGKKKKMRKTKEKPIESVKKKEFVPKEKKRLKEEEEEEEEDEEDEVVDIPSKKIDDPFFIEKKIIAPKLLLENLERSNNSERDGMKHERSFKPKKEVEFRRHEPSWNGKVDFRRHEPPLNRKVDFRRNESPLKGKVDFSRNEPPMKEKEESIHPSWAAKKVNLIKPFQGKKTTFSDD